ncbi:alpha/beta fold hydrolase [Aquisalibacillus elongatus]|uniref:Serine aminopeptidase S33 family n=1 Tax=Aquisalibacillus elongatus TaxID=485577 RepID=A0A3N5BBZ6_9BACI|nr:alpha/beta fold hydrolase [Aquisalibacillus elongatus]RPF55276.1 serine aminopeptidase S33 family [Aquisalibacillus elongatus]
MAKLRNPVVLLVISLLIVLVGSVIAYQFNSSSGETDVSRVYFETERGELSGLLYKPDDADQEAKPTLITTHGYLNSAEMQDAQAVEMSKRGYVVLALDQYDHGHSTGTMEKPVPFFSFWPHAIHDAVQYMYEQDYVLKDEEGNGIIAVSGHSMGGFSSTHAVMLDEMSYEETGIRKVYASLTMGSDYQWLKSMEYSDEDINGLYGPRASGKIAAEYDEFFFDAEAAASGESVVKKDYVNTEEGQGFLGNPENPEAGKVYDVGEGQRVIYQPNETHPWNHFSKESTGYAIDFYDMTFADFSDRVQIGEDGQTWMFKEYASFIALIGFFMLFIPIILLLTKLPFFKNIYTTKPASLPEPKTDGGKLATYIIIILGALFPALFFSALYGQDFYGMRLLRQISMITISFSGLALIYSLVKNVDKRIKTGSSVMLVLGIVQYMFLRSQSDFIEVSEFFGGPTVNPIVYWAINVALVILMVMVAHHFVSKKPEGATIENYGVKANVKTIIASLVTAVVTVVIGYAVLYLVDALFKVDFRLWTFAVKTFEGQHVLALLKYAPLFFIYFFIVGISVNVNTASEKYDGIKGYIIAILHFIGGLVLYLVYHYGLLFMNGTAGYPGESLSSILVIGLVPVLLIAAIFNRYLFRKTGNVYVGAFLNTVLMTMITVANTALYTIL